MLVFQKRQDLKKLASQKTCSWKTCSQEIYSLKACFSKSLSSENVHLKNYLKNISNILAFSKILSLSKLASQEACFLNSLPTKNFNWNLGLQEACTFQETSFANANSRKKKILGYSAPQVTWSNSDVMVRWQLCHLGWGDFPFDLHGGSPHPTW